MPYVFQGYFIIYNRNENANNLASDKDNDV
jgi:hypothetical protein